VLTLEPDNEMATQWLLQYYVERTDYASLEEICRRGANYHPKELLYSYFLGMILSENDKYDEALSVLERGLRLRSEGTRRAVISDAFAAKGDIQYKLGRYKEAYLDYDSALVYNKDNVLCMINYAYYLSLRNENLIPFRTELAHIETYLRLEKLRFQDELKVVYDIRVQDFMLPALSVQPLVENAVKHGVGQKIGGGTVTVHASETGNEYIICITDDGVGFVEGEYADESDSHVGIENTRKRLQMMLNARLEIESIKGEGTRVCIRIPKR
jgi:tetratricopeptide (TPR) repeat protein